MVRGLRNSRRLTCARVSGHNSGTRGAPGAKTLKRRGGDQREYRVGYFAFDFNVEKVFFASGFPVLRGAPSLVCLRRFRFCTISPV